MIPDVARWMGALWRMAAGTRAWADWVLRREAEQTVRNGGITFSGYTTDQSREHLQRSEVDLRGIMRILKNVKYRGWINIDHHYAPVSPRHSFERCMKYIREKLDRFTHNWLIRSWYYFPFACVATMSRNVFIC